MESRSIILLFSGTMMAMIIASSMARSWPEKLDPSHYDKKCPGALQVIREVVNDAIREELRNAASLLRLHFHDCFVNGCDGSVLLDATPKQDSEKNATPNANSLRAFDIVDRIKTAVNQECGNDSVVSCADILAVAARDSVQAMGGPRWEVLLGRLDGTTARKTEAEAKLPSALLNVPGLFANLQEHGLDKKDLVALSGAHTLGLARCANMKTRLQDSNNDKTFAEQPRLLCNLGNSDNYVFNLDPSPAVFDNTYFKNLKNNQSVLVSDQSLMDEGDTAVLVKKYSVNEKLFFKDFAASIIKMGMMRPSPDTKLEVRSNCRMANP